MNKIAKRLLTVILAAACVITALPDTAYEVYAEEIDIIADDVMTEDVVTEEDILIEEQVSVEEETDASEVAETEAEPEIAAPVEEEIQSEGECVEYCSGEDEAGIEEVIDETDMELTEDPVKHLVSANIDDYVFYIDVTSGGEGTSLSKDVTENAAFTFYVTPSLGYTVNEVSYKVGNSDPVILNYTEYIGPDSCELYEYKYVIPEGKITADTVISVSTKWIICTVTAVGSNFTADSKANPTLAPGKTFAKIAEYKNEEQNYTFYIKVKSGYKLDTANVKCYYESVADNEGATPVGGAQFVDYSEKDGYKFTISYQCFDFENIVVKVPTYKVTDLSKCTIKAYFDGSTTANSAKYTDTVKESGAVANKIEIYNGRTLVDNLIKDTDYTVSYENNKVSGTAYIILTAKDDSCFCSGSCKQAFSIVAPRINDKNAVSITYSTSVSWNGEETKLDDLVIKDITNPDLPVTLTEGTDYVLAYSNNTKPGKATITIVGINGYDGNTTVNYTINKLNLADALPVKEDMEVGKSAIIIPNITDTYTYNGKQYKPEEGQIIFWNRSAEGSYTIKAYLNKGTDYTVSYGKNVNAGSGTITITGKGNYTGKITREFTINKMNFESTYADLSIDISMADSFAYKKGKEVKPVPTVVLKNKGAKDIKLKANKDYKVTYPDADYIETGLKHLTIEGIGNFEGIKNESFYIAGKNIADKKLVTIDTTSATAKDILKKTYTGVEVILPSYECEQIIKSAEPGVTLTYDKDYTVSCSNNVKAGTAKVTISGIGQYYGTKTINMTISKANVDQAYRNNMKITLDGTEITSERSYVVPYTGYAHKPTVKIYDYNVTLFHILEEGVDFTVSYANNVNVGTTKNPYATATISFKGNYAATKEVKNIPVQFIINPWYLNDSCEANLCKIDIEKEPVFLGGKKEVKPGVTLKIHDVNGGRDRWLTVNPSAYKVTYPKNVTKSIGEVTATIVPAKGLNDINIIPRTKEEIVKGKTTKVVVPQECTYTIVKANIENVTVSTIQAQTFKGEAVTPKVTVKYNGVTLKEGTDYKVSYQNNKARGIGKVIIEPIVNSNYCGTNKIVEFVIK